MPEIFIAKASELKDGDRRVARGSRGEIGVFRHGGAYYAYANMCAHNGGPACEGVIVPQVVDVIAEDRTYQGQVFDEERMHFVCPWHGWEYEMKTGVCVGDPRLRLRKYEVVQRGDDIYVID
jgi:nitrite reductase/ring-hydroxylating ferredoxin subunit